MRAFNATGLVESANITGYVTFYVAGTQTLAVVTDVEGTALTNPQPLTKGRLARQVFLPNQDIHYEIRNTDDVLIEEGTSIQPIVNIEFDGLASVDTISDLSDMVGMEDGDVVATLGYWTKGDRAPVYYKYVAGSTASVDGGHVIFSEAGRWIAPDNGESSIDSMMYGCRACVTKQLSKAHAGLANLPALRAYSLQQNKPINVNTSEGLYFYLTAGSYIVTGHATLFSDNSQVVNVTMDESTNIEKSTDWPATFNVTGDVLGNTQFTAHDGIPNVTCNTFKVNANKAVNLQNCKVVVTSLLTEASTFTSCDITSNGNIKCNNQCGQTFTDCYLKESYFATGYNLAYATITNCTSSIFDWTDVHGWAKFCEKMGYDTIDFGHRSVASLYWYDGLKQIKNGTITDVYASGKDLVVEYCTIGTLQCANVKMVGTNVTTMNVSGFINATDSTFALWPSSNTRVSLKATGCTITHNSFVYFNCSVLENCTLSDVKAYQSSIINCNANSVTLYNVLTDSQWRLDHCKVVNTACPVVLSTQGHNGSAFEATASDIYVNNVVINGVTKITRFKTYYASTQGKYNIESDCGNVKGNKIYSQSIPLVATGSAIPSGNLPYMEYNHNGVNITLYPKRFNIAGLFTYFGESVNDYINNNTYKDVVINPTISCWLHTSVGDYQFFNTSNCGQWSFDNSMLTNILANYSHSRNQDQFSGCTLNSCDFAISLDIQA